MRYKSILSLSICLTMVMASCSQTGQNPLTLDNARKKFDHNPEIVSFIDTAADTVLFCFTEYGIESDRNSVRLMPGANQALAFQLTAISPLSLNIDTKAIFYREKDAVAKKAALEKAGKEVFVTPINPMELNRKPAPLMEAWSQWLYERKVERVMQIVMYQYAKTSLKRQDAEELSLFLAEKATEEYLRKKMNPASPVLSRYISEQRDARTFAILFPDFAVRVRNLYGNGYTTLSAEAVQKSRTMLLTAWLTDFRQKYTDRFLTNRYTQFGDPLPGDAEIAAWENHFVRYKEYNALYKDAEESVKTMLQGFL